MPTSDINENGPDGVITTVNNTATFLMSHDFQPDSTCQVNIRVVCRNPANGDSKVWLFTVGAKRVGTGTVALLAAAVNLMTQGDTSLAACTISLAAQGGSGRVNVTGLAATTLQWCGQFSAVCLNS